MEIHQLRYFCAVVKCGSFTKAAKREHVSQPSLSQQIIKLEVELGIKLFDRFHGQVGLTSAGNIFLAKAEMILEQLNSVKRELEDINGIEQGKVSLGVSPNISPDFLPIHLARFREAHSQVEVRVVEEVTSLLIEYLRDGLIDMALVVLPLGHAIAGEDLASNQIVRERLYVAVPERHLLADRKDLSLPDIRNEAFIFLKDGRCYSENIASAFRRAKLHPNVIAESSSALHVLAMVCSGIGISVVPEHVVDLRRGDCHFIPVSGEDAYSAIGLVQLKTHHLNRVQLAFAKFLGESAAPKQGNQVAGTAA